MLRAVIPEPPEAVKPVASKVVAIVAGTRTGLNMTKSGVLTANAKADPPRVIPATAKRATAATPAKTV